MNRFDLAYKCLNKCYLLKKNVKLCQERFAVTN